MNISLGQVYWTVAEEKGQRAWNKIKTKTEFLADMGPDEARNWGENSGTSVERILGQKILAGERPRDTSRKSSQEIEGEKQTSESDGEGPFRH